MRIISTLIVTLVLCPTSVFAGDEPDCENGSQMELNICAYRDFEKADMELNMIWPKAKKFAADGDADLEGNLKGYGKALLASQRGWLAYRDGNCEVYGFQARGGSMESMLVSGCKARMTKERVKELREMIEFEN